MWSPYALLRKWALGSDSIARATQLRDEVRGAVHSARNIAQTAIASSRRSERASEETTRVAEDAIRRVEQARTGVADNE